MFTLRQRQIRLDDSWDVVVVGGGPSGATAAVAAAREGARTLLLEATGCLGGMGTAGMIPAWCPFSDGEKVIYRGLAERVLLESKKGVPHVKADRVDWVPIHAEHLKRVYDNMVTEAGVTVRFFTTVAGVEMADDGRVDAVIAASKAGLTACKAGVFVDATGDGDVAVWAGATSQTGDDKTGETQPASLCFTFSNVCDHEYLLGPLLHGSVARSPIWDILRSGKHPLIPDDHMCQNIVGPGTVGFNAGHLWAVDPNDPANISDAMILGRRIAEEIRVALAEFHPKAFASAHLVTTASLMGIRETRRIMGNYVLTLDDWLARRSFDDEIARNSYFIDIHTSADEIEKVRAQGKQVCASHRFERYAKGESHGIPYRCLTPAGVTNVITAGRCISTDHIVQGSTRVMPPSLATGEAAGLAAAMAAKDFGADVHAVDAGRLRTRLREEGAYLP